MLASAKLQTIVLTARIDEAERFYTEVLGLRVKRKSHGGLIYDVGGGDLCLSPVQSMKPSAHTVVGFSVADLDAVTGALSARGLSFERIPGLRCDASGVLRTPEGARVVWLRDPDGNLLSIVQYAAAP